MRHFWRTFVMCASAPILAHKVAHTARLDHVGLMVFIEVLRRLIYFHASGPRYLNSSTQIHCLDQFSARLGYAGFKGLYRGFKAFNRFSCFGTSIFEFLDPNSLSGPIFRPFRPF